MVPNDPAAERPFGEESRRQLLSEYFSTRRVTPDNAWEHVYRLLLWVEPRTGLAHCYEADKVQPGRRWYARSLAFHAWLSDQLQVADRDLGTSIDWLFRRATQRLAERELARRQARLAAAAEQRAAYADRDMPEPGAEPELRQIIEDTLGGHAIDDDTTARLVERIRTHLNSENNRKNLTGEGFEDTLAELISRLPGTEGFDIRARPLLSTVRGFHQSPGQKERKPDLAIVKPGGHRALVSSKWSIRADREDQFDTDYDDYVRLESAGETFDYVLLTNEFDPARLVAAAQRLRGNRPLFDHVVHVNPAGVLVTSQDGRGNAQLVPEFVKSGRIESLAGWLASLTS
jgi:hypothetical protein